MHSGTAKKTRRTVLVVDDSPAIREQVTNQFLADGFSACVEARNGKEAIKVADECKPDLIVLDLSMPVMNGIDAAPTLRAIVPKAPIILFTLFADQLKIADLRPAGITAVYLKTNCLEKLLDKAHELMGR